MVSAVIQTSSPKEFIPLSKAEKEYTSLSLTENIAQKALAKIQASVGARVTSFTVTSLSLTDATATFARNVLKTVPAVGPEHPVISGLGYLSASIGLLMGSAITVGNGIADLHQAKKIGDEEGSHRAGAQILSGTVSANASALWLVKEGAALSFSSLAILMDTLCGIGALINIGVGAWGVYKATQFRFKINALMDREDVTEKTKVIQTLEFLKKKLTPTAKEKEAIVAKVEKLYSHWSEREKQLEVKKQLLDLAETKAAYIKRRTSQATAVKLLQEIDQHLFHLNSPHCKDIEGAKKLIQEVKNQNIKQILLTSIVALTSLISFVALILANFFSLGVLPYALLSVSSGIVLAILLYPMFVDHVGKSKADALSSRAALMAPITANTDSVPG